MRRPGSKERSGVAHRSNGNGRVAAPSRVRPARGLVLPQRRSRRPRHRLPGTRSLSRVASTLLVAVFMGAGALGGVLLLHRSGAIVSGQSLARYHRPYTDQQGRQVLYDKVLPPAAGKIYWGGFRLGAPYDTKLVTGLESEVGRRPSVLMWYQEWAGRPEFPMADAAWLFDEGIVPMITWEPWKPPTVFGTIV